jgi:hypothetical protein
VGYTPESFAVAVLKRLGKPVTRANVRALVGWEHAEGGHFHNDARFNPLNTTEPAPGAGNTGTQGNIKIYRSPRQGIRATVRTLRNGRYGGILAALEQGHNPQAVARAIGASPWGTSAALISKVIAGTPAPAHIPRAAGGGGRGGAQLLTSSRGAGTDFGPQGSTVALLEALGAQQRPSPAPSAGLAPPTFSAAPALPQGYQAPPSGGQVSEKPDIAALLKAIATSGQTGESSTETTSVSGGGGGGHAVGGRGGKVLVAPGADRAGVSVAPITLKFARAVSGHATVPLRLTTGTNHNRMTVDGNVSDHWDGHAGDFAVPIDSHRGDLIAAAALVTAGVPRERAWQMARAGGLFTLNPSSGAFKGHRIQVIWKTNAGGNHHNHVHLGIR